MKPQDDVQVFLERVGNGYRLLRFESLDGVILPLLRSILGDSGGEEKEEASLLSLTISSDEISLIIDEERYVKHYAELRGSGAIVGTTGMYIVLRVETLIPGLSETGILSRVTKVFAEYDIPVFCLSTFLVNYIFIPSEDGAKLERLVLETTEFTLEPLS